MRKLVSNITTQNENDELVERSVTPDKSNSQKKSREVKKTKQTKF